MLPWTGDRVGRCRRAVAAPLRLAGAVLVEAHDGWPTGDRRYLSEGTMAQLTTTAPTTPTAELIAA
ncbi:hypothetical protein GCM10023170_080260 [Phytohabitans houttuyneae]|uniref:Uncharacterized protein n=1 Tax=Phytohabitans houttuyneae TaxID=1076126 RepID=A0A6V8KGH7_9ACTN|nr:hypothetical protein Phou_085130 [Phytohabitans houttuyneae]